MFGGRTVFRRANAVRAYFLRNVRQTSGGIGTPRSSSNSASLVRTSPERRSGEGSRERQHPPGGHEGWPHAMPLILVRTSMSIKNCRCCSGLLAPNDRCRGLQYLFTGGGRCVGQGDRRAKAKQCQNSLLLRRAGKDEHCFLGGTVMLLPQAAILVDEAQAEQPDWARFEYPPSTTLPPCASSAITATVLPGRSI